MPGMKMSRNSKSKFPACLEQRKPLAAIAGNGDLMARSLQQQPDRDLHGRVVHPRPIFLPK